MFQRLARPLLAVGLLLSAAAAWAHGISEADKQRMLDGGYLQYIGLGASHMLTGYDHLLFLFGVVFFLTKFTDVAKFVTAFTLGHCITLIYKGFDNNGGFQKYFNRPSPNLLRVVFAFGLLHGFGLSTRLQQLPLGDDNFSMLMRILSFNVGVEIGQIAALVVMVALLSLWRKRESFQRFSTFSNNALMTLGALLLLMQLHGYHHDFDAENLRFPEEEHKHLHEDMDIDKSTRTGRESL